MQQKIPVICIQISLKNKAIKIDGGEGSGDGLQCATAAVEVVLAEMVVFFRSMFVVELCGTCGCTSFEAALPVRSPLVAWWR